MRLGAQRHRTPGARPQPLAAGLAAGLVALTAIACDGAPPSGRYAVDLHMRELPTGSDGRGPGRIVITLDRAAGEVCYRIQLSSGAAPTNGEIRDKDSGEAVVALFAGPDLTSVVSGTDGGGGQAYEGRACRNGIKSETIDAILDRPERYSVNVFNERFPGKALQGDLAAG